MKTILSTLFIFISVLAIAQDSDPKSEIKRNLVYFSAGTAWFESTFNGFYERALLQNDRSSFGIRCGVGMFDGFNNKGNNYNIQLMTILIGDVVGGGITQRDFL